MGLKSRISKLSSRGSGGRGKRRRKDPEKSAETAKAEQQAAKAAKVARRRPAKRTLKPGVPAPVASLATALWKGVLEVYAIAREMLSIAGIVALRVAERIGNFELLVLRRALIPAWTALVAFGAAAVRLGAREITPVRAVTAVSLVAIAVLAASQFTEYREVRAGVNAYQDVDEVVGAPAVPGSSRDTGSAHAYVVLALAVAAAVLLAMALRGRWRMARLLAVVGALTVLISVFIDAPKGLDEGPAAAQAFTNEQARLLAGFWAQLSAGVVLLVTGPLLAFDLDPVRARRRQRSLAEATPGPTLRERLAKRSPLRRGSRSRAQGAST
jgi:hypothetical protein